MWSEARLIGAALVLCACAGPSPDPRFPPPGAAEIRVLPGGGALSFADLAARTAAADLVIVGEQHDDPAHQAMQAALIGAVHPGAVAFEMIPRAAESALADLRAAPSPADALRVAAQWDRYAEWHRPVGALAPDAPAIGAGLARADLRGAMKTSAAAVFDGDPAAFGLDAPLPANMQAAMEAEQIAAHCNAMPAAMAPAMVEAQRLRDAAFARALLRADDAAGDAPAFLITGNGHARRDRGSPAYLPGRDLLVIGQINRPAGGDWRDALASWQTPGAPPVFDIVIVTDPPPGRGDPCDAFRKPPKS
ncbi:MAG: putative iron-regulated protein [Paracoccaceae bacterium]|jgi:uncharacterized iron-regulated protein